MHDIFANMIVWMVMIYGLKGLIQFLSIGGVRGIIVLLVIFFIVAPFIQAAGLL